MIIINCPHCNQCIEVIELNCKIFRCGVFKKNMKQISEFQKLYPDCAISNSNKNNMYLKIVSNSMSGLTSDESSKNINKIISNVAKVVTIDK